MSDQEYERTEALAKEFGREGGDGHGEGGESDGWGIVRVVRVRVEGGERKGWA